MKCIECDCCHEVMLFTWSSECNQFIDKKAYQCWGVKEPFVIDNIYKECSEYEYKRNKMKKEISAEDAINHYKHGITHDIFSEPVISYAKLAIEALEKQIPKRLIHIHEEHSEHLWQRNKDGTIDTSAMSSGFHNGPYCTRCHHSECEHCNPNWETGPEEPCVVDKDICPYCEKEISIWQEGNYCPNCGQALDWSD